MAVKEAGAVRPSARERLLAAANELFYNEGVHTVGIDRVIEQAGAPEPELLGRQLHLLYDGSGQSARMDHDPAAAASARAAAAVLLDAALDAKAGP